MSAPNSRKRAAPGASPMVNYPPRMQQTFPADGAAQDNMLRWNGNGDGSDFVDASAHGAHSFGLMPAQPQYNQAAANSNSLALIPTQHRNFDNSVEPWSGFGDGDGILPQNEDGGLIEQDNIEALEEMAQKAKREAQGKRKGIPPFVQKLSSFLEDGKNDHFIRWSEKGDSFIVLDEDEFAKNLIPEMFKHNNYASFVRQLNMYGFHKRVGLSDNSMRASERKNKSPSEYHNPFFRRGHPNLLWLINKPKSRTTAKKSPNKTEGGEAESDEEPFQEDVATAPSTTVAGSGAPTVRTLPPPVQPESQPLPKKEMSLIREELTRVREQQKMILGAISRLQRNNNDLYSQALMFQSQHDRHQNSINAILNFLANVFRKTLEDQGNTQSVSDIISSMITNQGQTSQQGNVVDLGDFFQTQMDPNVNMGSAPHKRARALLPPVPNQADTSRTTHTPSTTSTPYYPPHIQDPEMGHVTELFDGSDTPPSLRQELESNPHERMMRIINDHNATNTSGLDLPEATKLVADAPNTLNKDQRSKLVDFMAGQASPPSHTSTASPSAAAAAASASASASASANQPTPVSQPRSKKASVSPAPADNVGLPSLSPIMRSPQMAPPSLNEINTNQIDLDQLQRLQSDQDAKIHELSELLGPLSPSGRIPGLGDGSDAYFDQPNVDLDQFFDSNAFLNDAHFGTDGNDFNFNIDGAADDLAYNANGTPSPTGTEEIQRNDLDTAKTDGTKRRRVG